MAGLFFSEYIEGSGTNKALEIYNDTGAAVDLAAAGYVLQIYFNGSSEPTTIELTGTVADDDVFVFAGLATNSFILTQTDQTYPSNALFNGDDAIVLRKGGATGEIVDSIGQVGFDPGTEYGSGLTSTADNTLRRRITTPDTDPSDPFDPAAQFDGFPQDTFDGLGSFSGGTPQPISLSLTVLPASFIESAGVAAATGTIARTGDTAIALTVTLASSDTSEATVPTTIEIAAGVASATFAIAAIDDTAVDGDQSVTLTASATGFTDVTTNLTVTDDEVASVVKIRDIQGAAQVSPLVGQSVSNVAGIVTAIRSNGFYFQDPDPDTNEATSEGVFVFTSSAPTVTVGDAVAVSGTVSEFRPGGNATANLTTTQIGANPTVTRLSSGNALPAATILGNGGRAIPNTIIEDDASGNVEASNTFDPAQDGLDFYESVEGMRVQVNDAVAVSPTTDNGEIAILADNGANAGTRTPRGGIIIQPGDFNPERIILDDAIVTTEPQVNVGDRFNGAIVGVVDYSFGNFKLLNTQPLPTVQSGGLTRESTTLQSTTNQLTVAAFNVENLDPSDGNVKFAALADAIVNNLKTPDIISLEEVQDNNGATNDSVVDANVTYQTLIDAIATAGGPRYEFRQINPVDDQDGGEPGGNIRVGFLFNSNRVDFVDRAGGGSTTNTTVTAVAGDPQLSASPGRLLDINPDEADSFPGDDFRSSRKPLVGEFLFNGQTVFVIDNHFNSKGGDQPLFGNNQPPVLSSEAQRLQQAQIVNRFVDSLLEVDPNANIVALGDFNDFQFSNPLRVLTQGNDGDRELFNLYDKLPLNEQYSYVFDGNTQAIDHILVSNSLNGAAEFDVVHINSEFADQISDHDSLVARFSVAAPNQAPIAQNDAATTASNQAVTINVLANDSDADGTLSAVAIAAAPASGTVSVGSNGAVIYTPNANFAGSDSFTYTVQDDDGARSNAATVTVTVANPSFNEIVGTAGNNVLRGTAERDRIRGLGGSDRLLGLGGDDILEGNAGDDYLNGGAGLDQMQGGGGSDTYMVDNVSDLVVEAANAGFDSIDSSVSYVLNDNVERLTLVGTAAIDGTGNALGNGLTGNRANNSLTGNAGNDILVGEGGDDLLDGGRGRDQLDGGAGRDRFVLSAGNGRDTIVDFQDRRDLIALAGGLTFGQLSIAQTASRNTIISIGGQQLAVLQDIQAASITSADFVTL